MVKLFGHSLCQLIFAHQVENDHATLEMIPDQHADKPADRHDEYPVCNTKKIATGRRRQIQRHRSQVLGDIAAIGYGGFDLVRGNFVDIKGKWGQHGDDMRTKDKESIPGFRTPDRSAQHGTSS